MGNTLPRGAVNKREKESLREIHRCTSSHIAKIKLLCPRKEI
jgi:hypothetical protein